MIRLAPLDVVVALRLTADFGTFALLGEELGVSPSQVHASCERLATTGLLRPGSRATNNRALVEFLSYGVRYVFPATRGPITSGVPTAYSAQPLASDIDAADVVVWPAPMHPGAVQGFALPPLYPAAPKLVERSPATFRLLTITDALRLGDPRARVSARQRLEESLGARA